TGGTADRNRSHWSTSKTPSYTKSVSWQHHPENHLKKADFCMLFCFCEAFSRNNKSVAVVSFITQKWFSYRPG
ncbi:hypothetical protein, partial [Escherichia coli]|uniref:hypothetical protein n=1 Tax=Escherichia coli TaxID=562 RepID=UPI002482DC13